MMEMKMTKHPELIGTKYEHNPFVGMHPGAPGTLGLSLAGERWQEGYDFAKTEAEAALAKLRENCHVKLLGLDCPICNNAPINRRLFLALPVEQRRVILKTQAQALADTMHDSEAKEDLRMME
jgi:hypothetical protein